MDDYSDEQATIPGWGKDANPEDRPGVPQEAPLAPITGPIAQPIQQQSDGPAPLIGPNRFLTPVYSPLLPPRGLSGVLRRAAYKQPEYRARRWLMLMAADRIDAIEHRNVARAVVGASLFVVALSVVRILRA